MRAFGAFSTSPGNSRRDRSLPRGRRGNVGSRRGTADARRRASSCAGSTRPEGFDTKDLQDAKALLNAATSWPGRRTACGAWRYQFRGVGQNLVPSIAVPPRTLRTVPSCGNSSLRSVGFSWSSWLMSPHTRRVMGRNW